MVYYSYVGKLASDCFLCDRCYFIASNKKWFRLGVCTVLLGGRRFFLRWYYFILLVMILWVKR